MIAGAAAISFAEAPESEKASWGKAISRECQRYGLDRDRVSAAMQGGDPLAREQPKRGWWELLVVGAAIGIFIWLASFAERPTIAVNLAWMAALIALTLVFLVVCGLLLWRRTRFS
jgi:hypothetical protein